MAKRKTKKEKVVDLKQKPTHLSENDLKKIQGLASAFDRHHQEIGMLESRKHQVMHVLLSLQEQLKTTQAELQGIYGDYDIDIKTGELKEPAKQPENGQVNS